MTIKYIDHFKISIELKNGERIEEKSFVEPSMSDQFVSIRIDDDVQCHYNTDVIAHIMVETVGV